MTKKFRPFNNWIYILVAAIAFSLFCGLKKDHAELKVMTFNIRYDNPEDGKNRWRHRIPVVKSYLLKAKPDVIGMQEVLHNQLADLTKNS